MRLAKTMGVCRRSGLLPVYMAVLGTAMTLPGVARGQAADQFQYFFNTATALGGSTSMGGFAYSTTDPTDPTQSVFWTAGFGSNQAIRKVMFDGTTWNGTSYVSQTDWVNKFLGSSSTTDNGGKGTVLPSNYSSASVLGGMVLNPQPVTVGGLTYPAGTLAVIVDQATVRNTGLPTAQQPQPQYSKIVYTYDLRQTMEDDDGNPSAPALGGRDINGDGKVGWNDPFYSVATLADLQSVQGTTSNTVNLSRRPVFSSDGQSIYFNDAGSNAGGIWKVNLTLTGSAALTKVVDSRNGTLINTEPAVVSTSVHDFGGGAGAGDQIFFKGSTDTGNVGGLNYVVDAGTAVSASKVAISAKQFAAFFDVAGASADIRTITSDGSGNLYLFTAGTPAGVFMLDTQGRLVKLASEAEYRVFESSNGGSFSTSVLDTQIRTTQVSLSNGGTALLPQLLVNDNGLRTVIGITAYKPGDFNRDNVVDAADVSLFRAALGLRGAAVASNTSNSSNLKYDLNGSSTGATASVSIDWKDWKIFEQFAGLSDGDVNMDFAVNATDLNTLAANYGGTGKKVTDGNLSSVRVAAADKDDVNFADLVTLAANWTAAKPTLGAIGSIPQADLDRAFAITAGGTLSQYSAKGSGTWGNAANWTNGVPDAPGAVASLLTKPQDDATITIDGTRTVGQINFDNYFTYTLTGGTLRLQGANGTTAELNTFAASPTINSAVTVASNAVATITYASDTVTLAGPLNVAAGQTLTKAGPGSLKISGGGTSAGALAINAGTVEVAANTTVGALTGNGTGTLNISGIATTLKVNAHPAASAPSSVNVAALSLAAGTTLDLTNNQLIVNSGSPSVATTLANAIAAAYDGGRWEAPGITSSSAASDPAGVTAVGYYADSASFTALYTYYGDANLNGTLDADDYALLDRGFAKHLTGWANGDFNYSGSIDAADYLLIDRAVVLTHGGALSAALLAQREAEFGAGYMAALTAAVPEPGALLTLAVFGTAGIGRRRSRR